MSRVASETSPELGRFVSLIRRRTGNVVPKARHRFLEEVAERRVRATGQPDMATYIGHLAAGNLPGEWERVIPLVTIKESYFYRAPQQFRALVRHLLPRLLVERAASRRLDVWCAGCARGEEPGTLALVLSDLPALQGWDWRILATDIDEDALAGAERGIYGERAVGQVPPALRRRWFTPREKLWELRPELRARIEYRPLNLADLPWDHGGRRFDLVFLRNVLIYFPRPLQRRVVDHAARHLAEDGYLFLGASETLWQIDDRLVPADLGACFAYRHPRPEDEAAPRPAIERAPPEPTRRPLPAAPPPRPAPGLPLTPAERGGTPPPAAQPPEEIEAAGETGAAAAAPAPPRTAGGDIAPCGLQEMLSDAARHMAADRFEPAAEVLAEVLGADPSEPSAHALEGFLHDLQGRSDEAVTAYRAALYLDPALFQVRLLLADCLFRLGEGGQAERNYREVLASLSRGRERELVIFDELPFPSRIRAERRCREQLRRM